MHLVTSLRRAGKARPLALPMGELAQLKAVTERVPSQNLRIFSYLPLHTPSPSSLRSATSPIGRGKGGCAADFPPSYPLQPAGKARPLALPLGELARRSRD